MKFLLAFSASAALIAMTGTTTVDAIGLADAGFVNVTASTTTVAGSSHTPPADSSAGLRLGSDTDPHPALAAMAAQ